MSDRPTLLFAWGRLYCETFNFALVPIQPGEKDPKGKGWNHFGKYIVNADKAEAFWAKNPNHNLGIVWGPSHMCSLDVDDVQWTLFLLLELLSPDLEAVALAFPTVIGNPLRFRMLFRLPEGLELTRHSFP